MRRAPALIVGGGPAGSAAAIALARAGERPLVIERGAEPHDVVCGAFLGWDALAALRRLDVEPEALGARPISTLRLVAEERQVETRLPKLAAGLSRRCLDEALLGAAREAGAEVRRGRGARAADPRRRAVRLDDGSELQAETLLLATGKHELRGAARSRSTGGGAVGLRAALSRSATLERLLGGVIELHLFDGGYAGLLMQEDGCANLCLSVAPRRIKRAGGIPNLVRLLAEELPALGDRLRQGEPTGWSAVSAIPYGWRARGTEPGLFRLGDQGAVIASLAGDGIAIALASGLQAASMIREGASAGAYQRRLSERAAFPLLVAEGLRWAAERPLPRTALMRLIEAFPSLPRLAARLTRIGAG